MTALPKEFDNMARTRKTEETEVTEIAVTDAETPKRRGRKADPMTAFIREHRQAKARFARAEAKWAKVSGIEQEYKDAKEGLEAASEALKNALGDI